MSQLALALGSERHIYAVGELNAAVQHLFERNFRSIWVAGEISGCKPAASGHYYFNLKDTDGQIRCVLFKGQLRYAKFRPQEGMAVIARGSLEVYAPRGEYQLLVETLEPQGAGALQLAFEQLKEKLNAEGLFAQARKRPLPRLPKRIGIVTSPAGAVLRDIVHVLSRRFPGLHLRVFPALVQGEGSIDQVCAGLRHFSQKTWADVVIVARGGGSLQDLWTFNEEAVARAVAECSVPVISAVGHETDFTICDFVADLRAPTPSVAAEVVVPTWQSLVEQVSNCQTKLAQSLRYRLLTAHRRLDRMGAEQSGRLLLRAWGKRAQQLDDLHSRLREGQQSKLNQLRHRATALTHRLQQCNLRLRLAKGRHRQEQLEARLRAVPLLVARSRRLERADAHLQQLSPLAILGRGYAIVENADRHVLRSAEEATGGEELRIRLSQGQLAVTVKK